MLLILIIVLFVTFLLRVLFSSYLEYRAHRTFAAGYGIEDDDKFTGIVNKLRAVYKSGDTEAPIVFRDKMKQDNGSEYIWKLTPNIFYYWVNDPEIAKFLMNLDSSLVEKADTTKQYFAADKNGFNNGLLMSEGTMWKFHRRLLAQHFRKTKVIKYIEAMDKSVSTFTELLSSNSDFQSTSQIRKLCNGALYEIMFKCMMGDEDCTSQTDQSHDDFIKSFEVISKTIVYRVDNRFKTMIFNKIPLMNTIMSYIIPELCRERKYKKIRDKYMNKIIDNAKEKQKQGIESSDLASILTEAEDENGQKIFSETEIKCQLFTFAFGGHETAASTLIWTIYFLGEYPEWADRISQEFEANGSIINARVLQNIPQTEAFIKETLRLCHTLDLYIPRKVKADVTMPNGRILPKGFTFTIDLANMNTDKSLKKYV